MATASGGTSNRGSRFRSLEDYNQFPDLCPNKKIKQNHGLNLDPKTGLRTTEKMLAEFYIVQRIDNGNFEQISPFFIEKAVTNAIGAKHETKRLRGGILQVKCCNDKQAQLLANLNNSLLGNLYKIQVTEHATLNTVQGIIYCFDCKFLTEEEILEGLADQKVCAVRKIKKKVGDNLVDTALCILTFKRSILPTSIKFGFHNVLVKAYIPNPLRCFNCFQFGHTRKFCKNNQICALCSDIFHDNSNCKTGNRCINCGEKHNNWNKDCPKYKQEVAIQTIKIQQKISYYEAKRKYESFPNTSIISTFAQTLKSNTNTQFKETNIHLMSDSPPIPSKVNTNTYKQTDLEVSSDTNQTDKRMRKKRNAVNANTHTDTIPKDDFLNTQTPPQTESATVIRSNEAADLTNTITYATVHDQHSNQQIQAHAPIETSLTAADKHLHNQTSHSPAILHSNQNRKQLSLTKKPNKSRSKPDGDLSSDSNNMSN